MVHRLQGQPGSILDPHLTDCTRRLPIPRRSGSGRSLPIVLAAATRSERARSLCLCDERRDCPRRLTIPNLQQKMRRSHGHEGGPRLYLYYQVSCRLRHDPIMRCAQIQDWHSNGCKPVSRVHLCNGTQSRADRCSRRLRERGTNHQAPRWRAELPEQCARQQRRRRAGDWRDFDQRRNRAGPWKRIANKCCAEDQPAQAGVALCGEGNRHRSRKGLTQQEEITSCRQGSPRMGDQRVIAKGSIRVANDDGCN